MTRGHIATARIMNKWPPKMITITTTLVMGMIILFTLLNPHSEAITHTFIPKLFDSQVQFSPVHEFWKNTFVHMYAHAPVFKLAKGQDPIEMVERLPGVKTKEVLLARAIISAPVIEELTTKHQEIMAALPHSLPYKKDTSGVVFIGGGKFSWLSYVSLMALRDTGSTLPVEIILPTYEDYEREVEFCTIVLPKLNAACVVVPDVLGPGAMIASKKGFANYQYKSLALVVSSFQNVLLLDSDNVPLGNPDSLMKSKVFKRYGMITWPDFWERTTTPVFYDVAGVTVDETKRVRVGSFLLKAISTMNPEGTEWGEKVAFHEFAGTMSNPSTESGQFLINKATHSKTLLLSMYYNLFGPLVYYRLLSLSEPGEGDKDTFVAAAHVLNEPYYQVHTKVKPLGYFNTEGYRGVAMMQRHPVLDYEAYQEVVRKQKVPADIQVQVSTLKDIEEKYFLANNDIPYLFLHCNFPKLDPQQLMELDLYDKANHRLKYRMYSGFKYPSLANSIEFEDIMSRYGRDFELRQWDNMHSALCRQEIQFRHFQHNDKEKLCGLMTNQILWMSQENAKKGQPQES